MTAMAWRNTADRYGRLARWLHWTVAILFLAAYCAVYYRHWFTEKKTPENLVALHMHLSFGVSIAVFVILRVVSTLSQRKPLPPPGTALEHGLARTAHWLLYAVMLYMPITGYLGTKADIQFFYLFTIPAFPNTALFELLVTWQLGMTFEEWEKPLDFVHKTSGAWLVWPLVLLHAAAALYHHYVRRDSTLVRMWSGRSRR